MSLFRYAYGSVSAAWRMAPSQSGKEPYPSDKDRKKNNTSQRLSKKMFQNIVFFFIYFTMS